MGTSKSYGGPGNNTPLVPTWLDEPPFSPKPDFPKPDKEEQTGEDSPIPIKLPSTRPIIQPPPLPNRFQLPRTNLTKFLTSNGADAHGMRRGVSQYVSNSNGARTAMRRMGSSRRSGSKLIGFLSNAIERGEEEALRTLNLEELAGRPIQDIFLGLVDYICPDGGTIDEAIARDSFIETISDLVTYGITELNGLDTEQMSTVFEIYTAHTIEKRIYNDIADKVIQLPSDIRVARQIQTQLFDLILRGVTDALSTKKMNKKSLTQNKVSEFVDSVYENTFTILQRLGNAEAEAK